MTTKIEINETHRTPISERVTHQPSTDTSTSTSTKTIMRTNSNEPPCKLYSITQYQCTPLGGRVTCWPLERIFRQCGENKPAIEVTNRLQPRSKSNRDRSGTDEEEELIVDPAFISNPPKAKGWADYHGH